MTITRIIRSYLVPAGLVSMLFFFRFIRDVLCETSSPSNWRGAVDVLATPSQYWCFGLVSICLLILMTKNWKRFRPVDLAHAYRRPRTCNVIWISNLLLIPILLCMLARYVFEHEQASKSTDALVFFWCLLMHQWLIWMLTARRPAVIAQVRSNFIKVFIAMGCVSMIVAELVAQPNSVDSIYYVYHNHMRWVGIWQNPNIFGLIMSVVFVFSIYQLWRTVKNPTGIEWVSYLIPVVIGGVSVLNSYSRGAWMATFAGSGFLLLKEYQVKRANSSDVIETQLHFGIKNLLFWLAVGFLFGAMFLTIGMMLFNAHVSFLERVFSIFNTRDFSSQNRLASYQDGVRMLLDRPWVGYGWDNIVTIHSALYLQSGLWTGEALKLNDFLVVALRFGFPIFALFMTFVWVWLSPSRMNTNTPTLFERDILLCRVAIVMFGVGFLFTDGLFRLVSGGSAWLFLTLGGNFSDVFYANKMHGMAGDVFQNNRVTLSTASVNTDSENMKE